MGHGDGYNINWPESDWKKRDWKHFAKTLKTRLKHYTYHYDNTVELCRTDHEYCDNECRGLWREYRRCQYRQTYEFPSEHQDVFLKYRSILKKRYDKVHQITREHNQKAAAVEAAENRRLLGDD